MRGLHASNDVVEKRGQKKQVFDPILSPLFACTYLQDVSINKIGDVPVRYGIHHKGSSSTSSSDVRKSGVGGGGGAAMQETAALLRNDHVKGGAELEI